MVEYYPNNVLKRKGEVSSFPNIKLEDEAISYHKNGKIENRLIYKRGKLVDSAFYYFDNGHLREIRYYFPESNSKEKPILTYKIVQVGDSTGNLFLDNYGNGKIKRSILQHSTEEGLLKNGLKEGTWIEYNAKENIYYEEQYNGGIFQSGFQEIKQES